jgi:hypothetical protein
MALKTIPWNLFLEAIDKDRENSETLQAWLNRWLLTNDGAVLIRACGDNTPEPPPLEEQQAVIVLMTKGKWQTTVH